VGPDFRVFEEPQARDWREGLASGLEQDQFALHGGRQDVTVACNQGCIVVERAAAVGCVKGVEIISEVQAVQAAGAAEEQAVDRHRRRGVWGEPAVLGDGDRMDTAVGVEVVESCAVVLGGDQELSVDVERRGDIEVAFSRGQERPETPACVRVPAGQRGGVVPDDCRTPPKVARISEP